ncbi:distinct helicase family with a unique C-terminal domain including a metal-binding cysteine cluster [Bellilinea caldifistulae]|uniref:DEAD/DEAH box helicase n=1 Tax=Bellilinea caldifistulae TaxID=360411 RepID=A0A0N8GKX7_9CHLR|nr:DEAD/DEAH box helicase [Bellilinea caldifistulae]KPL70930.1 hypothetical protein AC812_16525 [Bellilinea caldifistulae]GAP11861.1 distinct helicase family with a unique C-terminal domain including a metal-binding cysteine cluster [Bellilinea caldifistulae]
MKNTLHPIHTTAHLRDTYIRYLKTIKPFQDERLRKEFAQALEEEDLLIKGPYLEITPPFETGKSIRELVQEGILSQKFQTLCDPGGLDYERPLYLHQETAIRKVRNGRNVVVTTGTGSGKTETFLIPILDALLREEENGTLSQPGVRGMLLYPMNALANDQMDRLRSILKQYPAITFGRYIGETPDGQNMAEQLYRELHRESPFPEPLPNELISRQQMQQTPPHLLLTNYAMLEYLLLRPKDSPLFDGETGQHWRFIVLDEAHVYDGAQGTEIAMLLRRLQERVTRKSPKTLQAIATSATLGDESPENLQKIVEFASRLFNLPFEWIPEDTNRQDVVLGKRKPESELGDVWGEGTEQLYVEVASLAEGWRQGQQPFIPDELSGVPDNILSQAAKEAQSHPEQAVPRYIYQVLRGDGRIHKLRSFLREKPYKFNEIAGIIFEDLPKEQAQSSLANLVSAAILAREMPQSAPLLPARYHVFIRALEGAFVCLNTHAPEHQSPNPKPILFLKRQKFCPHCGSRVFEIANCTRCGVTYLIGNETSGKDIADEKYVRLDLDLEYLTQNSVLYQNELEAKRVEYFSLEEKLDNVEVDEDALIEEKAEIDTHVGTEKPNPVEICPKCGALYFPGTGARRCDCGVPFLKLAKIEMEKGKTLIRCTSCSTYNRNGVVYRFLTGQDAPVSVLAGALYEHVPPARKETERQYPGEGRKMLVFSDNRQQAAFFAAYLERAQKKILQRRLITKMLKQQSQLDMGEPMRVPDCLPPLIKLVDQYGVFYIEESIRNKRIEVASWLMQEFSGLDKRISLEGVGLVYFQPKFGAGWMLPEVFNQSPWNLTSDEAKNLLTILLNTLRRQGAVTYLLEDEGIDLLAERQNAFLPRNKLFYVRNNGASVTSQQGIYSWCPAPNMKNTRLDYLTRLLRRQQSQLAEDKVLTLSLELLMEIWEYLTGNASPVQDFWLKKANIKGEGVLYRLNHQAWEVIPAIDEGIGKWYICDKCQNLTPHNLNNVCPTYGCMGSLHPLGDHGAWLKDNMYRSQYLHEYIVPLEAEEHTAQWVSAKAAEVQKDFVVGKINVLSSSTTFELGVDVGDLNAVVLRNMPPSSANYIQRAGRTGRRTDSVAMVVTFAQRRPHDLMFYDSPETMVSGKIRPPIISLKNDKIIRRHLHSVVFAAFFRWVKENYNIEYRNVGDFVDPENISYPNGPELLKKFLQNRPSEIELALERIIPNDDELRETLKLKNWEWQVYLLESDEAVLDKSVQTIQREINEFQNLEQQASANRNYSQAQKYMQIQKQIRERDLLGYLGSTNVLPKYGFPTDVVTLQTNHLNIEIAKDIQLERDLQIAISEFAPGGQVVAAKRIWYSKGIKKHPQKSWEPFSYAVCPNCKRMNIRAGETAPIDHCAVCGTMVNIRNRLAGTFIIPELGFVASSETDIPGEQPPERIYASKVYFSHYTTQSNTYEKLDLPLEIDPEFSSGISVYKGYSRYGWLVRVNNGYGDGFRVCRTCGYAEVVNPSQHRHKKPNHKNPETGKECSGTYAIYHLGHRFMTDVLELNLSISIQDEKTIYSVLYALLFGAVEKLDIPVNEVDGVVYYREGTPSFILYDNTPGGAGYVRMIYDNLYKVFEGAYDRVVGCKGCSQDTSCYSCLRSYQNQYLHDKLERRLAWIVLGQILDKPLPHEDAI